MHKMCVYINKKYKMSICKQKYIYKFNKIVFYDIFPLILYLNIHSLTLNAIEFYHGLPIYLHLLNMSF